MVLASHTAHLLSGDRLEQKIVYARPPNFDAILRVFPGAAGPRVLFSYGDTIYCPQKYIVPRSLIVHEAVHGQRQLELGLETWWDRYLAETVFRFEEELVAHRAEYKAYCDGIPMPGRHARDRARDQIAERLSGPLYGNMISKERAWAMLI